MNTSAEAADQIVRMSLNGVEVAAKITGAGAEKLTKLIYSILKDQKKTKGKTRLSNMLRSGKELKIFQVNDNDLSKFCSAAKKYGVLYTVLKDRNGKDGKTEIMVRAEDSAKVAHIYERFNIATVDIASVEKTIEQGRENADKTNLNNENTSQPAPERAGKQKSKEEKLVDEILKKPNPSKEEVQNANPSTARTEKGSNRSEPYLNNNKSLSKDYSDRKPSQKPSVRKELNDIRKEQESRKQSKSPKSRENAHQTPKNNKKKKEKSR